MRQPTVEVVCRTCGIVAEMPLSPCEMRAVTCESCGREMLFLFEDVAEEPAELERELARA